MHLKQSPKPLKSKPDHIPTNDEMEMYLIFCGWRLVKNVKNIGPRMWYYPPVGSKIAGKIVVTVILQNAYQFQREEDGNF
jgi:hypothetical protein